MIKNRTLILNRDGSPLSVINTRRAIRLMLVCSDIVPLKFYDETMVHGDGQTMQVPAVLLYREYVHYDIKKCPSKNHQKTSVLGSTSKNGGHAGENQTVCPVRC